MGYYVFDKGHVAIRLGTSRGTTYFVNKPGLGPVSVQTSQQLIHGSFISQKVFNGRIFSGYGNYRFMPWFNYNPQTPFNF